MLKNIIYIKSEQTFIDNSMISKLKETGFSVISLNPDASEIYTRRNESDIILYHVSDSLSDIDQMMDLLTDLCSDSYKALSLIGDATSIPYAMKHKHADCVSHSYIRPIDFNQISQDMQALSEAQDEYRREKSLMIVDDDEDFLSIISIWLKNSYQVTCAHSGSEMLSLLQEGSHPDLILLDYKNAGNQRI